MNKHIIVIICMVIAVYSNTFRSAFHFDDYPAIVDSAVVREYAPWSAMGGTRPLTTFSNWLNFQLCGLTVVGWHTFNITVHVANACLVYLLFLGLIETPLWALFGALVFAIHPIQTEAVTYIIGRSELLATFFYILTILLFTRRRYGWAFLTACLAMASKEWAVTLPAVLLLYDFMFPARRASRLEPIPWRWHALIACSWLVLVYTMSTSTIAGAGFGVVDNRQAAVTPWIYLLTSLNVLWTYIGLLFAPIHQNLDYGYPWTQEIGLHVMISLAAHLCVISAAAWLYVKRRSSLIPFGIAWFYITISPAQSIVPVLDVIFEHRLYLPSVGMILVFVAAMKMIADKSSPK